MQRLEQRRGLIRRVDSGGRGKAARYILLTQTEVINNRVNNYDSLSSQTILIRNPGRTYGTVGKRMHRFLITSMLSPEGWRALKNSQSISV